MRVHMCTRVYVRVCTCVYVRVCKCVCVPVPGPEGAHRRPACPGTPSGPSPDSVPDLTVAALPSQPSAGSPAGRASAPSPTCAPAPTGRGPPAAGRAEVSGGSGLLGAGGHRTALRHAWPSCPCPSRSAASRCSVSCLNGGSCRGETCLCRRGYAGASCGQRECGRPRRLGGPRPCPSVRAGRGWRRPLPARSPACPSAAVCERGCPHGGRCVGPDRCACVYGFRGPQCRRGREAGGAGAALSGSSWPRSCHRAA